MGGKIVIADDAAFMRMMLRKILGQGGYEVSGEAKNGLEAVEMYFQLKPNLITIDITMPEMDGITAAKEIIGRDKNANIIMCSAMGQQAIVIEALQAGAKDFIVKPFQDERVIEAIQRVIG